MAYLTTEIKRGTEEIEEYDDNGNRIHVRNSKGYEVWYEYDDKGNCIRGGEW